MTRKWSRRDVVKSGALATLLAPMFLEMEEFAQAQAAVKRMILCFIPNGSHDTSVFVTPNGSSFDFGAGYAPLNPFKSDIIALKGYYFENIIKSEYDAKGGEHGGHVAAARCLFSGHVSNPTQLEGPGLRPSIDQIVASEFLKRGMISDSRRKSLNVQIGSNAAFGLEQVFYQTPPNYQLNALKDEQHVGVTLIRQPLDGFALLFQDLVSASGDASFEDLWARRKSILDAPVQQLKAVRTRLPKEGMRIVDAHIESLVNLEKDFQQNVTLNANLQVPEAPRSYTSAELSNLPEEVFTQWVKVINAGFRHDRTRVATITFAGVGGRLNVPSLGFGFIGSSNDPGNSGSDHHSYSHHGTVAQLDRWMSWYMSRVAELMTAMKGNDAAQNLMPSIAMMVGQEARAPHGQNNVPVFIAGQGGGYFKSGRLLNLGDSHENVRKHTATLLAMCHSMGITEMTKVGASNPDFHLSDAELQNFLTTLKGA